MGEEGRSEEVTGRDLARLILWAAGVQETAGGMLERWPALSHRNEVQLVRTAVMNVRDAAGELREWCEEQIGVRAQDGDLPVLIGHCYLCRVTYGEEGHTCPRRSQAPLGTATGVSGESTAVGRMAAAGIDHPGHQPDATRVARVPERPPVLLLGRDGPGTCHMCGGTGIVEYQEVEYEGYDGRGEIVTLSQPCNCQVPPLDAEDM